MESASFSPDGSMVVTASGSKIKLWRIDYGKKTFTLGELRKALDNNSLQSITGSANHGDVNCKCVATFENVYGLYVSGCDFRKIRNMSSITEHEKDLLKQYGALI